MEKKNTPLALLLEILKYSKNAFEGLSCKKLKLSPNERSAYTPFPNISKEIKNTDRVNYLNFSLTIQHNYLIRQLRHK